MSSVNPIPLSALLKDRTR